MLYQSSRTICSPLWNILLESHESIDRWNRPVFHDLAVQYTTIKPIASPFLLTVTVLKQIKMSRLIQRGCDIPPHSRRGVFEKLGILPRNLVTTPQTPVECIYRYLHSRPKRGLDLSPNDAISS
jgi:hypothetical protein